jgi:hypothetical protein
MVFLSHARNAMLADGRWSSTLKVAKFQRDYFSLSQMRTSRVI